MGVFKIKMYYRVPLFYDSTTFYTLEQKSIKFWRWFVGKSGNLRHQKVILRLTDLYQRTRTPKVYIDIHSDTQFTPLNSFYIKVFHFQKFPFTLHFTGFVR